MFTKSIVLLIATASWCVVVNGSSLQDSIGTLEILFRARFDHYREVFDVEQALDYLNEGALGSNQVVKKAVEGLKEVVSFERCDSLEAWENIGELGRLIESSQPFRAYVYQIFEHYAPIAAAKCVSTLDQAIERIYDENKSVEDSLAAMGEGSLFSYDWHRTIKEPLHNESVAQLLRQSAGNDARNVYGTYELNQMTGQKDAIELKNNFDQMFRQYLIIPCKKHIHAFAKYVPKLMVLGKALVNTSMAHQSPYDYIDLRPQLVQDVAFRYYLCQNLVSISNKMRDEILKCLSLYDLRQARIAAENGRT